MIPIYTLCTPSHAILRDRFFGPTVPKDLALRLHFFDNPGSGFIHDPSFCRAIVRKVQIILQAIEENWGEVFVWSDVDVQFFQSIAEWVIRTTAKCDLVFQIDGPGPALCDGFFFCRATEQTRSLWRDVLAFVEKPESRGDDQYRVRQIVGQAGGIRIGYLPPIFVGGGTFTGKLWERGDPLLVPAGIVVHHANFTCGVPNKIAQCELVRLKVASGDLISFEDACERTGSHWFVPPT